MRIRAETGADAAAIRRVTQDAFTGAPHASGTEAAIVDGLRAAGTLALSLVAEDDGGIVGHVAFSPVTVDGRDPGWLGLGPVSVRPDRQRLGIGSALIREGLSRLRESGAGGCVLLGDPGYYARFGFEADPALRFEGAPPAYFLRLLLSGPLPSGSVIFQPAFYRD
jgi:putative acetyltransferase